MARENSKTSARMKNSMSLEHPLPRYKNSVLYVEPFHGRLKFFTRDPSERPDAVPGQHLHFTQIPRYETISNDTGLTDGYHVTIRFDGDYKQLNRREVKAACVDKLKLMNMPLGVAYSNPIDIGINTIMRNWTGFIKIHLQFPKRDGLALLRGDRAFVLAMEDGGKVISKVEKGFELVTKARNMRLHLKGDSLRDHSTMEIFRDLIRDLYYEG